MVKENRGEVIIMAIEYHAYFKDYVLKDSIPLGILRERRKKSRVESMSQSGLRWAKKFYGPLVRDPQAIFVKVNIVWG